MKISVFVGTSVDGFIARPNGELDFLPPGGGEPHGYNEFIATVDAICTYAEKYITTSIGMQYFTGIQSAPRSNIRSPSGWRSTTSLPVPL